MGYSTRWVQFSKAEEAYFFCRQAVLHDEATLGNDLKQALTTADRETALRLLAEMPLRLAMFQPLLADVLDAAIDSSNLTSIALARQVIAHYRADSWVRNTVTTLAAPYLASNDDWHYRRIAELYRALHYNEELTKLLALCQASASAEIREIHDDFSQAQG